MRATQTSVDECWWLEHPPVYTLGQAGRREHILNSAGIAVQQSDRGGTGHLSWSRTDRDLHFV